MTTPLLSTHPSVAFVAPSSSTRCTNAGSRAAERGRVVTTVVDARIAQSQTNTGASAAIAAAVAASATA